MINKSAVIVIGCAFLVLGGCGTDDAVTVSKSSWSVGIVTNYEIDILSKVDDVDVTSVIVNRGNCKADGFQPKHLKFGEKTLAILEPNCNPLETTVETSKGAVSVSWND